MAIEFKSSEPEKTATSKNAPQRAGFNWNTEIRFGAPSVSIEERMVFTERISLLLETGVSLLEAIKALQLQAENPLQAQILEALVDTITEGKSFSVALAMHPEMFSPIYIHLVAAAEGGGFLPQVLEQLYKMDEKNAHLRSSIISALSYPAFLIVFSIAVVIFVLVSIFPKFEVLFASIKDQLPVTTIFLMSLSTIVRQYWWLILLGLGAATSTFVWWIKTEAGRFALDRFKMSAPIIKDIYVQIYLNQALGVLGLSLANGVPITTALKACKEVISNKVFAHFLEGINQNVTEGRGISIGFSESPLIPPMVRQMVSTAEQTGNLALIMTRIADFYARELNKRINLLAKAIEPIMLIVMGVVVGLIVVSLILPIFKLSRAMH
ncbi:MAG: type II secretion system F family protein [Methylophilaceae bacterium]|nr:type II secretion system F family protein [Methylophilaceae bacterium]